MFDLAVFGNLIVSVSPVILELPVINIDGIPLAFMPNNNLCCLEIKSPIESECLSDYDTCHPSQVVLL